MLYCNPDDKVNLCDFFKAAAASEMHPRCKKLLECIREHGGGSVDLNNIPERETLSAYSDTPIDELDDYLIALSVWSMEYFDQSGGVYQ